ncbi:MAG: multi-sensor signal transduction histidine [Geobacteraceae bacterium]|nr:MAG: multi-sensor signal transduction histidine [Geobacteraceae bacterium]
MPSLKKLNVGKKLWFIIGSALAGIIVLISMSLVFLKDGQFREKEHMTRHLVESAHSVIDFYYTMARDGKMSREEAQASAIAAVKAMHFDDQDKEYFWINDMQPKVIMHPIKPELDGKDVSDLKDPRGKRLFVEFVDTVKAKKAGFVYYLWPKPGFVEPVLKVSYVKGFEPWGWIVGSGIYLDDVNALFWSNAKHYALAGMTIFFLILAMCWIVAKNITRTEESLRISEEKFFKAFHASPDGVVINSKAGGLFMEANEAFFRILGYGRDEVIGHTSLELGLWVDPRERSRIVERTDREGAVRDVEIRIRVKSGETRTFLWSSDVINLNDEECLIVTVRDITSQKENERQLLKSKAELTIKHEQLSALFSQVESVKREWERTLDCINDMVILLDREGRVRRCNRATAEFAGIPYEDIPGLDWQNLVQMPEVPSIRLDDRSGELYHEKLNRWFFFTCYPYSENGGPEGTGAVITIHDTTETKRAAMELGKAYAELKDAQTQLIQQEKMASIGQMAAGVAHEINNPTGFIMSNLGTLRKYVERLAAFIKAQSETITALSMPDADGKLAALQKQLKIDHIVGDLPNLIAESLDGAERIKKIAQDLKCFSRVDEAECTMANLTDCIESTINIVWNELKYKVTLKKEYGELSPVKCYPQQLSQVFMNLLVNAAHAIEKQGEITVRTWQESNSAYIAITDTGCGISEEIRSRIFEPFFTTKEAGKGTGLGLPISYDIIRKHGGDISVESTVGAGTTFTVRLPMDGMQSVPCLK